MTTRAVRIDPIVALHRWHRTVQIVGVAVTAAGIIAAVILQTT